MIKIKNISRVFGDKIALKNINIKLPNTGLVIIKGENGSGKSTLMNLIGALDKPTNGSIEVDGELITSKKETELSKYREEKIGFIFQDNNLFENMTVEENIKIVGYNQNLNKIVEFLGLQELLSKKASELSGGEQQKVAIARAILKNPRIILADEPTSSLDHETKIELMKFLKHLSSTRLVIVITHDNAAILEDAELIVTLETGKIILIEENMQIKQSNVKINTYKNIFNPSSFSLKELFSNKKKLIRSSILLLISFLLLIVTLTIGNLDYLDMEATAISKDQDGTLVFTKFTLKDGKFYDDENGFTDKDIEYLRENKISKSPLIIGKEIRHTSNNIMMFKLTKNYFVNTSYYNAFNSYIFVDSNDLKSVDYGSLPNNPNEIVISSYLGEMICKYGVTLSDGSPYKPNSLQALIDDRKEISLGVASLVISGIVNFGYTEYDYLKDINEKEASEYMNLLELLNSFATMKARNVYIKEGFFDLYKDVKSTIAGRYEISLENGYDLNDRIVLLDDKESKELNLEPGDILLNQTLIVQNDLNDTNLPSNLNIKVSNDGKEIEKLSLKVKGISQDNNIYVAEETLKNYIYRDITVRNIYLVEKDKDTIKAIMREFPKQYNEYTCNSSYSYSINNLKDGISFTMKIFKFFSIFAIVLSSIYMVIYLLESIRVHKKDIAILKSLGIRGSRILEAFTVESTVVTIGTYILSLVIFLCARIPVNNKMSSMIGFHLDFVQINIAVLVSIIVFAVILNIALSLFVQKKIKNISPLEIFKGKEL